MKNLFDLFWTFFRIGGLTFGGGYAILPIIQKELVEQKGWATNEDIIDYYAVGQCTPGVIAVNTATFIGYRLKGITGAIIATFGVVTPSLIIITAIASFLESFSSFTIVQNAFSGIRVAVVALIITTIIKLWKSSVKDWMGIIIAVFAFISTSLFNLSPIYVVVSAAIVGFISKFFGGHK